jgi:hypothetical protein
VPKSQREAPFTIAALHQWEMDINDDRCVDSAEEVSWSHESHSSFTHKDRIIVDRRHLKTRASRWTIPKR